MIIPLPLIDSLTEEAVSMAKMPMDTTREVAMYTRGIRLTAQAWPAICKSDVEESPAEIQKAQESGERSNKPEFMARPAQKQLEMGTLLQFVTDYPEPLTERYYSQAEYPLEQGPALSL